MSNGFQLAYFTGFLWLLLMLGPLLLLQKLLHREIQAIFLILTRRPDITMILFSLLFLPGVFLHELSHYLIAWLLRVPTGRFSLIPHPTPEGKLQLGSVETAQTDFLRDSLIGAAPLLLGVLATAYIGLAHFGLTPYLADLQNGTRIDLISMIRHLPSQSDFWLWFYLAYAISSTMFPSQSDRRGWLPVVLVILVLVGSALVLGAGSWMLNNIAPFLNQALIALALVFGISLGVHLVLILPVWGIRRLLNKLTGLRVV